MQGVGFRPFVARLASELGLRGFVRNESGAACIEVEGPSLALDRFASRLLSELPPPGRIERASWHTRNSTGEPGFVIDESASDDRCALTIPPDLAACAECLAEVDDATQRRYRYPFTNCARCGPRFSIVRQLPYDRACTSMAAFEPCAACHGQYRQLSDRRHHAQPIACPRCGPQLRLLAPTGAPLEKGDAALQAASSALRRGEILALKGVGGFQLLVDATAGAAVAELRLRKRRPHKPFAVLVRDLDEARGQGMFGDEEAAALASAAAPIVLVRKREPGVSSEVAPGNSRLGLMLPATPLHHLLARAVARPLVCTSGNLHHDPIARDDSEAFEQLATVADVFLTHDRAIEHRIDDSVVHRLDRRMRVLRLGRGLAPLQLALPGTRAGMLCTGAHMNAAPALTLDDEIVLWPHVGDLDSPRAEDAFSAATRELCTFFAQSPRRVVHDAHPDYASTRWAERSGLPARAIHHHHAHVAACLAEHHADDALAVVFDGTGLGPDGSVWGGEFLHVSATGCTRVAQLRGFPLPGGDLAARDGRRALAGVCVEAGLAPPALARPFAALARNPRLSPRSSSAGRLFDAVAAWLGVCERSSFEGQAALALEHCATLCADPYPFELRAAIVDWAPMLPALAADRHDPVRAASRFHATLSAAIVAVAMRAGHGTVALAGGCMQNHVLVAQVSTALRERGKRVLLAERVPCGDGGIALGQAWIAARNEPNAP